MGRYRLFMREARPNLKGEKGTLSQPRRADYGAATRCMVSEAPAAGIAAKLAEDDMKEGELDMVDVPYIADIGLDYATLKTLREQNWVARSDRGLEVLRFREGLQMLEHKELEKGPSFQKRLDELGITDGKPREDWNRMLVTTEGEARRALRRPLTQLLAGPQMRKLEGAIRDIVDTALDEIEDLSNVDLMSELAWKIPSRVYCHLVAAPVELAPTVAQLSDRVLAPILTGDQSRRQDCIDAFYETQDFVRLHLNERRKAGLGEDFASKMLRQQDEGLQTEEELHFEAIALLQASVDNTVHQIGLTLGTLLRDRSLWEQVVADPALVNPAIEETMRISPRFNTIFRYARNDMNFNGQPVSADTWVYLSNRAAGRDPEVFADPDTFRFDRGVNRTLQFGGGPYNCLGQILARVELQAVLHAVRERFPNSKLTGEWQLHETNAVNEVGLLPAALA